MLIILEDKLPIASAAIPYVVKVEVDWPKAIQHRGTTYYFTRKEGIRIEDGLPSAEYELPNSSRRAWLGIDGAIVDDP